MPHASCGRSAGCNGCSAPSQLARSRLPRARSIYQLTIGCRQGLQQVSGSHGDMYALPAAAALAVLSSAWPCHSSPRELHAGSQPRLCPRGRYRRLQMAPREVHSSLTTLEYSESDTLMPCTLDWKTARLIRAWVGTTTSSTHSEVGHVGCPARQRHDKQPSQKQWMRKRNAAAMV